MLFSKKSLTVGALALLAVPGVHLSSSAPSAAEAAVAPGHATYEVSVTNLTRGQIFSPPVVATHTRRLDPLFTFGSAASSELAAVAEDAINQPLIDKIVASGQARDVILITGANGPIMPGETASATIKGDPWFFNRISMAGMLVITNDAFFGLDAESLPLHGVRRLFSSAYDAGSEANNELCSHIPGPPCGNPGVRMPTGAEGYVHVHAGIHGIGDLDAANFDWRDRVALIEIRRVR